MVTACGISDAPEAVRYWRELRSRSAAATESFIRAAATGDSVRMSMVAADPLIRQTLRQHRAVGGRYFQEMAATYDTRSIRVYGSGSETLFTYTSDGTRYTGAAVLAFYSDTLKLTSLNAPVKID
jgi:hypothetical protein